MSGNSLLIKAIFSQHPSSGRPRLPARRQKPRISKNGGASCTTFELFSKKSIPHSLPHKRKGMSLKEALLYRGKQLFLHLCSPPTASVSPRVHSLPLTRQANLGIAHTMLQTHRCALGQHRLALSRVHAETVFVLYTCVLHTHRAQWAR